MSTVQEFAFNLKVEMWNARVEPRARARSARDPTPHANHHNKKLKILLVLAAYSECF